MNGLVQKALDASNVYENIANYVNEANETAELALNITDRIYDVSIPLFQRSFTCYLFPAYDFSVFSCHLFQCNTNGRKSRRTKKRPFIYVMNVLAGQVVQDVPFLRQQMPVHWPAFSCHSP